jgi:hypothetical protein
MFPNLRKINLKISIKVVYGIKGREDTLCTALVNIYFAPEQRISVYQPILII